jgi:hypothetical protein
LKTACLNDGIKAKDLIGIPWRVAFALQADGWYLRSDIIWHKPNPMPESVTDRPTKAHEYLFLLTKSPRYYYDAEAIKEPMAAASAARYEYGFGGAKNVALAQANKDGVGRRTSVIGERVATTGRNKRTVWTVNVKPFKGAHFAVFPPELVEPCVKAGTSEVGVCVACGTPFERVIVKGEPDLVHQRACGGDANGNYTGTATKDYSAAKAQDPSAVKARILAGMVAKRTVDWRPACECGLDEPVPATVLDPFTGSGTTGVVALKHGRNFIGTELNPDYAALAKSRLDTAVEPSVFA